MGEFVGDALDDLCEYNPELPICKDDPGLDVGLPDVVHDLCALFPQVCDGEDVPPGSDSLPGNFSLPDVCAALPDLFFCGGDEIPEDWESVSDQICDVCAAAAGAARSPAGELHRVWSEEEETVQGEARGFLRVPEEGQAVPPHALKRGHVLDVRQEEAL